MSNSIRVLMADDSAAVRRLVTEALQKCPGIDVVAAARNGSEALALIAEKKPDVVLLDVEMPVMDGIDALKAIRATDRRIPVLMFSSLTVKGGEATLDALSLGATDYVAKPTGLDNVQHAITYIQRELVPRIQHWGTRVTAGKPTATTTGPSTHTHAAGLSKKTAAGPIDIIAIGSSTGGPNALSEVLSRMPGDLAVPIVIVQHMPTVFTKLLAERLHRVSPLSVKEACEGDVLRPGQVLVAPGDFHMTVQSAGVQRIVSLNKGAVENSCRPAVDVLFRSVARVYGSKALGVILTGMGKDGKEGCAAMKNQGASIIAQDAASCVVWGMPRAVTEAGLADNVVSLNEMHSELVRHSKTGRKPSMRVGTSH